ncbi:MAG: heavy-metal-associated domain-containing protein [Thermoproteota archaeon]|nr:heavy-metal-associated domain-containing protein [Thermoproteota archaeon]
MTTAAQPAGKDTKTEDQHNSNSGRTASTITTKRTVIKIGGMHCAGCVNAIQGYVSDLSVCGLA